MNKIGIVYHPMIKAAHSLAKELDEFLSSDGVAVWLCSAWDGENARAQVDGTDLILSIGGDGTILRAVQAVVPHLPQSQLTQDSQSQSPVLAHQPANCQDRSGLAPNFYQ